MTTPIHHQDPVCRARYRRALLDLLGIGLLMAIGGAGLGFAAGIWHEQQVLEARIADIHFSYGISRDYCFRHLMQCLAGQTGADNCSVP